MLTLVQNEHNFEYRGRKEPLNILVFIDQIAVLKESELVA